MIIRKAKVVESKEIANLFMLAMDEIIFHFIGDNSIEKAIYFLDNLIRKDANQYSYENCWVVEKDGETVAVANIYDGARLKELRAPVEKSITSLFKKDFNPEDETQSGELYIDSLGVRSDMQEKGIGTELLKFLIVEYVDKLNKTIGLLVDEDKPDAKRLYLRLGFKKVGEKMLAGKKMEHLQIRRK